MQWHRDQVESIQDVICSRSNSDGDWYAQSAHQMQSQKLIFCVI